MHPDAKPILDQHHITADDVRELRTEAGAAGDLGMVAAASMALNEGDWDGDTDRASAPRDVVAAILHSRAQV